MKKLLFIILFISLYPLLINAQISHGGEPYSNTHTDLKYDIDYQIMPEVDVEQLLMEDAIDENYPDIPWRFGKDMAVDYNMNNTGTWEVLPNGDRLWRLEIISYGAYAINLIFSKYYIPQGGNLFLYNPNKDHIIGSFTSANHKPHGGFATVPVKGERCILEYYEPKNFQGEGELEISYVIHSYKDFYANFDKGFGSSGDCNVNVNCPEGDEWQDEKRGVAMILTSNNARKCSGSMINNTAQDGTPYFLTANHCKGGGSNDWIIMFNYESPSCENIDGPLDQSIQYTTMKASSFASDFMLLELSEIPPNEYNVYYNGWNRLDVPSEESVCIHHPKGDIKKITFDEGITVSDQYQGNTGLDDSHWKIVQWELGTTEPGSSGSPLFNNEKQIVGQLHGGFASCTSLTADWYGKFSTSWDYGNDQGSRLMEWLDPMQNGDEKIGGFYPSSQIFQLNAQLVSALKPESQYQQPIDVNPTFVIRNKGSESLQSLQVSYRMDNGDLQSQTWTGNVETNDTAHVIFPSIYIDYGLHELTAYVDSPNGEDDEFLKNDSIFKTINLLYSYDLAVEELISPNGAHCSDDPMIAKVLVKNNGYEAIDGVKLQLQIDDGDVLYYEFEEFIQPGYTKYYVLDTVEVDDDEWHTATIKVEILNEDDQLLENNMLINNFTYFGNQIVFNMHTDANAQELSWVLRDQEDHIIDQGSGYNNNTFVNEDFCLPAECYTFTIYDSGGDGIDNVEGFTVRNATTGFMLGEGIDFGDSSMVHFCIGSELSCKFTILRDTACKNSDVFFYNQSTGADYYSWRFEGGNPIASNISNPVVRYANAGIFDVKLTAWQGEETIITLKEDYITVINCTGLQGVSNHLFNLYPNPSKGNFAIEIKEKNTFEGLNIYNQMGASVYSVELPENQLHYFELDLPSGLYVVELLSSQGSIRKLLFITK